MENNMVDPEKIKTRTTRSSTSGKIPKGNKNTNLKRYLHLRIHSSIIYNSRDMETICVHQLLNEEAVVCIYIYTNTRNGMLFSHKKMRKSYHCVNKDGP